MEVVVAIASKVGEYLVKPTVNQVRYLFCFNTIVEKLKEQEINLKLARENVNKDVEIAKNNTDTIKGDVEKWLTDANKILADVEGLKEETGVKKTCLNGWCPNWGCRYWLGRKAAKKTTIMLKLKDNCQFNGVGYPTTLPGIEFLKPSEFQTFGSSKSAMDDVIGALKNDEIHMVGLYGMGGAGKTTLAKEVGNRVKEIFNEVVMVTISQTRNFKNIQGQLAGSLGLRFTETEEEQGVEGRARRLYLRFTETEKKILVILDDVWEKFELKSILGIPFADDNKNCKILLTTRRQQVCIDMECQSRIRLNVLNDDEAVALLKRHAGIGDASNLNPLAIKIAKECDGLPLALVAIGSALREKDSDEWKVLHDKLRDSKLEDMISVTGEDNIVAGEKGIYATLKLSYDYLKGEQIQFCFLLCSLFPEDYEISLDELVRIGMGLDLYQDVNSIEELRKQFRVMVNNLKASGLLIDAGEEVVKMHDMVRDIAIWISSKGKHVFMNKARLGWTKSSKKNMLEQCTAISLMDNGININLLPQSLVCPRLEILLLNFGIDDDSGEFFKDMKALQVVTLIDVYPMSFKSLELLTNLQSLKLKGCELRDISFLGKLTGLKVLDLEGSSLAEEWPKELGDQLSELRVLDVRLSEELRIPRDGLRRFSQLEELYTDCDFLWDSDETTSVEESCATLYELNSLSRLVTLSLQIEHRCLPNGFAFRKLERYRIEVPESVLTWFSGKYERSISIRSIEAGSLIAFEELLQNVQSLRLWEIKGLQNFFPSVDQTCFSELIYLESEYCEELKCIIDMSQWQAPAAAFSNLKTLILSDMSHLEEIYKGAEPPNTFLEKLETVKISNCHSMCNVYPPMLLQRLHQLKKAEIFFCNKLSEVFKLECLCQTEGENSAVLSSLESLKLWNLPELRFIWKGPVRLVSFKNLAHVEVHGCSNLKNLFPLSIVRCLVQLEELIIRDCERLEHIVSDYNQGDEIVEMENGKNIVLPKLTKLRLLNLPKLISFCSENYYPTCPVLQLLRVDGCPNWTTPIIFEANMQNPPEFLHLQDGNDDIIPVTLVHGLQNLEDVELTGCAVQVVFQLEGVAAEGRKHKLSFPSLKNLKLKFLEKLEGLCMGLSLTHVPSLRNLTKLEVDSCSRLRYIFSATLPRNMMQLKYLYVSKCAELEQIIVVEEEEDQAFLNNNLQPETFQNLSEIKVRSCSKLKCLFPTTIARGLQQLEELYVEDNVQLEEVFGHKDVAGIMEDEEFELPQLNYLKLRALPSLTNFCPGGCHFKFPSLRKLEFQECGATVPIFSLTGDECVHADEKKLRVLRIGDCNNLCGGISLFSCGFNNLEDLRIWNCGVNLVFQLGDVAVDGQSHQLSFPSLKKLDLGGLKELEGLCTGSQNVLSLQNLTTLNISYCRKLTHIFSASFARNMLQLKSLSVESCKDLEQIVVEGDDDHLEVLFPNLSQIHVKWCDKLKCILPISTARGLQLQDRDVRQNFQLKGVFGHEEKANLMDEKVIVLPQLEELTIVDAPQLISIFYFENVTEWYGKDIRLPKLRKLLFSGLANLISFCPENGRSTWPALEEFRIYHCPNLTMPFLDQVRVQNLMKEKLRVLRIGDCNNLCGGISPFSCGFNNLEYLSISNCGVKVVFPLGDVAVDGQSHQLSFPSLKNLDLHGLNELEGLCNGSKYVLSLQNLTTLSIFSCHRLTHIFSPTFARNMLQLKILSVADCMELQQIVVEDDDDDDHPQSLFPNLSEINVKWCDKLKCVIPITMARDLQQLKVVTVAWANQLEEVFGHTDRVDVMTDNEIQLPQLDRLYLKDLPNLANFCPIGYHFIFPSLNTLIVERCPEMNTAFSSNQQNEFVHAEAQVEAECRMISSLSFLESTITYLNSGVKVVFKQGDLPIDGQPQQISFPSLKISDLHGLEELEDLCKGSQYVLSLQNLTTLNISCCRKLTHIFSASFAQNMLQLKSLSVEGCKDLEQIVVEDDDDHLQVLFPNLSQIHVKRCDKLKYILPISIARGLQPQDRDVRQNFQLKEAFGHEEKANLMDEKVIMLPQLEELTIVDAPQLKSIFYFENVTEWYGKDIQLPKLRKLLFSRLANLISFCPENCPSTWPALEEFRIYHCPNLTMPFLDQVRVQNLMKEKLRVLRIGDCNNLCGGISPFSCGFNNLEDLRIWNCGVKVVFQLGDLAVDGQSHHLSFPSLKKLDLAGLKGLEGLCNGSKHVLSLQNLTTLSICSCHRLTHIFSTTFARNMLQLETLSVEGCTELQQIVVEVDDDHLQSLFPNLSKIHVKWCDKLKCVLPITMARGLQQLKLVTVAWANQLEEIFGHTDRVDVMTDKEIRLPQLDELLFQDLPNFANFCPVGYHFIFPSLNTLIVERCPEMNTAFSLNQQNKFVHAEAKAPKRSLKNKGVEFTLEPPVEIKCWKSDHFPKVLPLRDEQTVTQQNDIEN